MKRCREQGRVRKSKRDGFTQRLQCLHRGGSQTSSGSFSPNKYLLSEWMVAGVHSNLRGVYLIQRTVISPWQVREATERTHRPGEVRQVWRWELEPGAGEPWRPAGGHHDPCLSSDPEAAIWKVTYNRYTQAWEGPPSCAGAREKSMT